jgi:hypothetical protein
MVAIIKVVAGVAIIVTIPTQVLGQY